MPRCEWVVLILLGGAACQPPVPCGCFGSAGPALSQVCADGTLDCAEHCDRYLFDACPATRPALGMDQTGVTWTSDVIGGLPNPFHSGVDCFRGTSAELGLSSYQCCYAGEEFVSQGPQAGSFDFVYPYQSLWTAIGHYLLDVIPWNACTCSY